MCFLKRENVHLDGHGRSEKREVSTQRTLLVRLWALLLHHQLCRCCSWERASCIPGDPQTSCVLSSRGFFHLSLSFVTLALVGSAGWWLCRMSLSLELVWWWFLIMIFQLRILSQKHLEVILGLFQCIRSLNVVFPESLLLESTPGISHIRESASAVWSFTTISIPSSALLVPLLGWRHCNSPRYSWVQSLC